MSKRYAIFDANALGTSLDIDRGGTILTTTANAVDINRTARGSISVTDDDNFVEFIIYGESAIGSKISLGIVTASASLSLYVGGDAEGMGYRPAEGKIYENGSVIASVATGVEGDVVGVRLQYIDGDGTAAWYLNGVFLHSEPLPAGMIGDPIFWAVSLGSVATAGDIKVLANSGADAFEYPIASGGWWTRPVLSGPLRVSDVPFVSLGTDSPAHARFEGGITPQDIITVAEFSCWVWGDNNARGSATTIAVIDERGFLDGALGGAYRDQPCTIVFTDSDLASGTSLGDYIVERVECVGEIDRRIVLRDSLALLEEGVQKRRIRPDASEDAAGRLWPTLLGACFSVEPPLLDETEFVFAIDSLGAQGIGKVRDQGNPLSPAGSPVDYVITDSGQTVTLTNVPFGIVTIDASTTGGAYVPPSPTDGLGGIGNPFAGTIGAAPTGWTAVNVSATRAPQLIAGGKVSFVNNLIGESRITVTSGTLTAGTMYRVSVTIDALPQESGGSGRCDLIFAQTTEKWYPFKTFAGPGVYDTPTFPRTETFIYTPVTSHAVTIYFVANNSAFAGDCEISNLTFDELPAIDVTDPDDEVEDALEPLTLEAILQQLIEVRGGLESSAWSAADAAAIDTATGYRGLGLYVQEQATIRECINGLLAGHTAGVYPDDGFLRIARLVAPEDETSDADIGLSDLLSAPYPVWDEAPGLTRQMGVRRNERVLSDSDLATDEVAVSMALRRKLGRQHRYVTVYGGPLAQGYDHADAAEPVPTRLVRKSDGEAEITRVGTIFSVPRYFWPLEIWSRPDIKPGMIVTLTYPRFGLDAGKKFLVKRKVSRKLAKTEQITLWGLGPE